METTGERVAQNIGELRRQRGLSVRGLAARLDEIGHPLAATAVSKIELHQRRVDADDLVALAIALEVSPSRLLLGAQAREAASIGLTPAVSVSEAKAWRWAAGDRPLSPAGVFRLDAEGLDAEAEFPRENRPHDPPDEQTTGEVLALEEGGHLTGLRDGYRAARAAGVSHGSAVAYLGLLRAWLQVTDDGNTTRQGKTRRTKTTKER